MSGAGRDHDPARKAALSVLEDVTRRKAYCNLRLKALHGHLEERDVRFVSALVYTVLDRLLYIDRILDTFVEKQPQPLIRNILRLGICELLFMRTPSHAVVSEYVVLTRAAGKPALSGFVNAVLRKIDRSRDSLPAFSENPVERLSSQYSCPEWIVRMWLEAYGEEETAALLQSDAAGMTVRPQYPYTVADLMGSLPVPFLQGRMDPNALCLERGFDVTSSEGFLNGDFAVQSEGAMLVCRALGSMKGKKVLDACAAPGGKSAYIASLSENEADLVCFELHQHRVNLLNKNFARLHVSADIEQRDAAVFDPEYENAFDAVLLDVPCSGLGLLKEKPDIRYSREASDIEVLAVIQKEILETCCRYVKPGGILVYATCTISSRENEEQVEAFLLRHKEFRKSELPFAASFDLQLLPSIHGTDGFYIARMEKCI